MVQDLPAHPVGSQPLARDEAHTNSDSHRLNHRATVAAGGACYQTAVTALQAGPQTYGLLNHWGPGQATSAASQWGAHVYTVQHCTAEVARLPVPPVVPGDNLLPKIVHVEET
mgnify:FL=1